MSYLPPDQTSILSSTNFNNVPNLIITKSLPNIDHLLALQLEKKEKQVPPTKNKNGLDNGDSKTPLDYGSDNEINHHSDNSNAEDMIILPSSPTLALFNNINNNNEDISSKIKNKYNNLNVCWQKIEQDEANLRSIRAKYGVIRKKYLLEAPNAKWYQDHWQQAKQALKKIEEELMACLEIEIEQLKTDSVPLTSKNILNKFKQKEISRESIHNLYIKNEDLLDELLSKPKIKKKINKKYNEEIHEQELNLQTALREYGASLTILGSRNGINNFLKVRAFKKEVIFTNDSLVFIFVITLFISQSKMLKNKRSNN